MKAELTVDGNTYAAPHMPKQVMAVVVKYPAHLCQFADRVVVRLDDLIWFPEVRRCYARDSDAVTGMTVRVLPAGSKLTLTQE